MRVIEAVAGAPVPVHLSLTQTLQGTTAYDIERLDDVDGDGLEDSSGVRMFMTDNDAKHCTFRPKISSVARKYDNGGNLVRRMEGDVKQRKEQLTSLTGRANYNLRDDCFMVEKKVCVPCGLERTYQEYVNMKSKCGQCKRPFTDAGLVREPKKACMNCNIVQSYDEYESGIVRCVVGRGRTTERPNDRTTALLR